MSTYLYDKKHGDIVPTRVCATIDGWLDWWPAKYTKAFFFARSRWIGKLLFGIQLRDMEWVQGNLFPPATMKYWQGHDSVLDVGCGNGRMNQILHKIFPNVYCLDNAFVISPQFMYPNVKFFKGNFEEILFTGDLFDCVAFFMSFYAMEDKEATLRKALDVLKPGGIIYIADDIGMENRKSRVDSYELDELCDKHGLIYDYYYTEEPKTKCSFIILR